LRFAKLGGTYKVVLVSVYLLEVKAYSSFFLICSVLKIYFETRRNKSHYFFVCCQPEIFLLGLRSTFATEQRTKKILKRRFPPSYKEKSLEGVTEGAWPSISSKNFAKSWKREKSRCCKEKQRKAKSK
jgi:hypothetical protein